MQAPFVEQDCAITAPDGRRFSAGGAWLCACSDGYSRGVVYVRLPQHGVHGGMVTTWHGDKIASASFGRVYRGNLCRMQAVTFWVDGVRYAGRYCPDTCQCVRVRSTTRVGAAA